MNSHMYVSQDLHMLYAKTQSLLDTAKGRTFLLTDDNTFRSNIATAQSSHSELMNLYFMQPDTIIIHDMQPERVREILKAASWGIDLYITMKAESVQSAQDALWENAGLSQDHSGSFTNLIPKMSLLTQ